MHQSHDCQSINSGGKGGMKLKPEMTQGQGLRVMGTLVVWCEVICLSILYYWFCTHKLLLVGSGKYMECWKIKSGSVACKVNTLSYRSGWPWFRYCPLKQHIVSLKKKGERMER